MYTILKERCEFKTIVNFIVLALPPLPSALLYWYHCYWDLICWCDECVFINFLSVFIYLFLLESPFNSLVANGEVIWPSYLRSFTFVSSILATFQYTFPIICINLIHMQTNGLEGTFDYFHESVIFPFDEKIPSSNVRIEHLLSWYEKIGTTELFSLRMLAKHSFFYRGMETKNSFSHFLAC